MHKTNRTGCFLTFLAFFGAASLHAGTVIDKYLIEAAKNNPGIKAMFNEYLAALENIPQAGVLPDPQAAFGYFIQPVETRVGPQKFRFSASQMFPWFGTLGAKKDAAQALAKAKYEQFNEAKSRLFFDVKNSWYDLNFTRSAIAITQENIGILNTFRKLALIKVEAGLVSAANVLRVEMDIADLKNQLARLRDTYTVLRTGFNNMLNVENTREVRLPDTLENVAFDYNAAAVLDSIRNGNHRILQMEFIETSYRKQETAAKKSGLPSMKLGFDYMVIEKSSNPMIATSESGRDAIVFPMFGISFPLYRQKYSAMVREAVLMQKSTNDKKRDLINALETAFDKTDKEYQDADRRISLNIGQSAKANRALSILRTGYETSGADFAEVLRMERQLLKYSLELEKALADKASAAAFIMYLMGK